MTYLARFLFAAPLCALLLASGALPTRVQANEAEVAVRVAYLQDKVRDETVLRCASMIRQYDDLAAYLANSDTFKDDPKAVAAIEGLVDAGAVLRGVYRELGAQRFGAAAFEAEVSAYQDKMRKTDSDFDNESIRSLLDKFDSCYRPTDA